MKAIVHIFLFLTVLHFVACVKTFTPDLSKYDELLVVDGEITDAPGPYTIILSLSSKVQEKASFKPYSNCKLEITDNVGNKAVLQEQSPGVYKTDSAAIRGVTGRSYKLSIVTSDGNLYESTADVLPDPLKIKSVYAELSYMDDPDYLYRREGLQFYLDTENSGTTVNPLFWKLQCTYKFDRDVPVRYYFDGILHNVYNGDTFKTCYRTENIPDLYMTNTTTLNQSQVLRFPLKFQDNYSKELSIRYSLKVVQYKITPEAYTYWNSIKKMRDAGGDIYTVQPYQIKNNLMNVNNPEKIALGYFTVASVDEKRIFVNRPLITFRYGACVLGEPLRLLEQALLKFPELYPIFLPANKSWPAAECMDCRVNGVEEKPSFWVD